jgi:ADP-ribose pyrophosphatase YjhB (NUDIX family)
MEGTHEVGLIFRETPHQGKRWCFIGGRLLLNELFRAAIIRQVSDALGSEVRTVVEEPLQPLFVSQYQPQRRQECLFDPRQHAIGLIFPARLRGKVNPRGEALDFQWFDTRQLPEEASFGFDQGRALVECVRNLIGTGWAQAAHKALPTDDL